MKTFLKVLTASLTAFSLSACMGPVQLEKLENVGPNETAFVIPVEGDTTAQGKFESVEYLEKKKVLAKRVTIPTRKLDTGRWPGEFEWIPTVRVIKVDRSLVTREWVNRRDPNTGKVTDRKAILVESSESVNFGVGVNITAMIQEEDAPRYLYWHSGKPLSEVIDTNIRGFIQSVAAREFGRMSLEDAKKKKGDVFVVISKETIEHFKKYGITIQTIGSADGLDFDEAIQLSINNTQTAQAEVEVARQQKIAQEERNKMNIAKAEADRKVAEEFAKAQQAQQALIELEIKKMNAQAALVAATRWNGATPSGVVPSNSNFLFGFGDQSSKK